MGAQQTGVGIGAVLIRCSPSGEGERFVFNTRFLEAGLSRARTVHTLEQGLTSLSCIGGRAFLFEDIRTCVVGSGWAQQRCGQF